MHSLTKKDCSESADEKLFEDEGLITKPQFPYLPKSKFMLLKLVNSKTRIVKSQNAYHSEEIHDHSLTQDRSSGIMEIDSLFCNQFRKLNVCSIKFGSNPEKSTLNPRLKLTEAFKKLINEKSADFSTRYDSRGKLYSKSEKFPNKFQTIDESQRKVNSNMFTPRLYQADSTKKSKEILQIYRQKFSLSDHVTKEVKKNLNTCNFSELTDRRHFQQLRRLRLSLENQKLEEIKSAYSKAEKGEAKIKFASKMNVIKKKKNKQLKKSEIMPQVKCRKNSDGFLCEPWDISQPDFDLDECN